MIGIYFTAPGFDDYPFNEATYRESYALLARLLTQRGAQCCIVRGNTYRGGRTFSRGWIFDGSSFRETSDPVSVDLIFNRGNFRSADDPPVLNHPELEELCRDKFQTWKLFADFCPHTIVVESREELNPALKRLQGNLLVAKPLDAEGGKGVIVGTKEEVQDGVKTFPYLLQEFIDTRAGIPRLVRGLHDLRIVSIEGKIVSCFIRVPKDGSFVSNVGRGGVMFGLGDIPLPKEVLRVFTAVDAKLRRFPHRYYALDLGRHRDGSWKIFELNSQPGLGIEDFDEPGGERLFTALADLLSRTANEVSPRARDSYPSSEKTPHSSPRGTTAPSTSR